MQRTATLYQATIGKKAVMAATGVILVGFVVGHMLGNLQIYLGPDAINEYSAFLHKTAGLLWGTRVLLLASVVLHIGCAWSLTRRNIAARPQAYKQRKDLATNYAARTMRWSGPILLLFIVYHLLHLTIGVTPGEYQHSSTDVYSNVVSGFQVIPVSAFYILAMLALGLHLFHGIWSMFQSLGIEHPRYNRLRRRLAWGITAIVVVGNISIPVAVMTGLVS